MSKITNKDLIGKIEGYPIEVVEKVLEHMKEQRAGGIKELQEEGKCALCWSDTPEGWNFWREIFWNHNFDLFYDKYPKKHSLLTTIFVRLRKWFKLIVK